jgi:transcriptional regulator with XRE-family HTH domain
MTLAQLGGDDFSRSYLSAMERGKCRASVRALTILARRLGLPVSHFVYGCDGPGSEPPEAGEYPAPPFTVGVRVEQRSATEVALILDITPRTAFRTVPFPGERSA